jgi:hypothetical protein
MHYILHGTEPREEPDVLAWGRWFETANRHVAFTTMPEGIEVSTVFLGLDHQWADGPPLLFETMCFKRGEDSDAVEVEGFLQRYSTYQEAEQGHAVICARVRTWLDGGRAKGEPEPEE